MIKRTLMLAMVAISCTATRTEPTSITPKSTALAHFITTQANATLGAEKVEEVLAAARDTKIYVQKHSYVAGSIVAIAAGPQRLSRAITLPFRFVARTASTMLVVAATTLTVMHREEIASWVKEQVANAKSTLGTLKENGFLAATRLAPSEPVELSELN
jgi:uncharacterized membrane protein YeiB